MLSACGKNEVDKTDAEGESIQTQAENSIGTSEAPDNRICEQATSLSEEEFEFEESSNTKRAENAIELYKEHAILFGYLAL